MLTRLFMLVIIASAAILIKRYWFQARARGSQSSNTASPSKLDSISRTQALAILGLEDPTSDEDIHAAYKRLMSKVHPDKGGTALFAQQLNAARTTLLENKSGSLFS